MKIKTDRGLVLESEEEGVRVAVEEFRDQVSPELVITIDDAHVRVLESKGSGPKSYRIIVDKSKKHLEQRKKKWLRFASSDVVEANKRSDKYWRTLK